MALALSATTRAALLKLVLATPSTFSVAFVAFPDVSFVHLDAFRCISPKEMALFDPEVRRRTDALDAAGNTTAAIGKAPGTN